MRAWSAASTRDSQRRTADDGTCMAARPGAMRMQQCARAHPHGVAAVQLLALLAVEADPGRAARVLRDAQLQLRVVRQHHRPAPNQATLSDCPAPHAIGMHHRQYHRPAPDQARPLSDCPAPHATGSTIGSITGLRQIRRAHSATALSHVPLMPPAPAAPSSWTGEQLPGACNVRCAVHAACNSTVGFKAARAAAGHWFPLLLFFFWFLPLPCNKALGQQGARMLLHARA